MSLGMDPSFAMYMQACSHLEPRGRITCIHSILDDRSPSGELTSVSRRRALRIEIGDIFVITRMVGSPLFVLCFRGD